MHKIGSVSEGSVRYNGICILLSRFYVCLNVCSENLFESLKTKYSFFPWTFNANIKDQPFPRESVPLKLSICINEIILKNPSIISLRYTTN